MRNLLLAASSTLLLASCSDSTANKTETNKDSGTVKSASAKVDTGAKATFNPSAPVADAATIIARKQVPVLCYHHIRYPKPGKKLDTYSVLPEEFKSHMKALADSGYHTISPDELHAYLTQGARLPENPVLITFDDTDEEQFSLAKPEMDKYGFKATYFIMTISIGRPNYMTKEQIKQLADEGHNIESHTWRHDRVDRYLTTPHIDKGTNKMVENDWDLQLGEQRKKLEAISGKEIHYFAYPFGIWNQAAFPELKKRGFKLAFQLSDKRDPVEPLYTVRRIIVPWGWDGAKLLKNMRASFK